MDERSLINNKFIDTRVYNIKENPEKYLKEQAQFRQFMGKKKIDTGNINFTTSAKHLSNVVEHSENIIDLMDTRKPVLDGNLSSQDYLRNNSIRYDTENNQSNASMAVQLQAQQAGPKDRFVQERRRWVAIDTRDRDLTLYPDQNNYKIDLGKEIFTNIVSVKMKGAEFINTQQLIRETPVSQKNNVIQWNIEDDKTGGIGNQFVVYTATLTPGNYTETTLAAEIENEMNSIVRSNGQLNNFTVTIDSITDTVEFTSVSFSTFANPFSVEIPATTENFTTFVTAYAGHGFSVGQRIEIQNSLSVGGIDASLINTEHVITAVPDTNSFEFHIVGQATSAVSGGGGASVRIGTGVNFQLLFSEDNSPAAVLGFQEIDTGFAVRHQNTKEIAVRTDLGSGSVEDNRLHINTMLPGDSANTTEIRTTLPHLLTTGDRIFIFSDTTAQAGVNPYDHEYTTSSQNTTQEDIRKTFVANITDPAGLIITVLDSNTFSVPIEYGDYITSAVGNPTISAYIAANVDDNDEFGHIILKQINAAIDLTGEKYIYMTSRILGGDMVSTSDNISDVFARIQLAGNASASIFNSYIGGVKIYYDTPLSELDEVDFQFRTQDGELFEFNDRNHSFVLEITEAIQKIEGSGYSARIGART